MKIDDILGYWQLDKSYRLFNGQIVIQQNGWLEGYAKISSNHNENEIGFLFGFTDLNQILELFFCSSNSDLVYRFSWNNVNSVHQGYVFLVNPFTKKELNYGRCFFSLKELDDKQLTDIHSKIDLSKSFMGQSSESFYQQFLLKKFAFPNVIADFYLTFHSQITPVSEILELCNLYPDESDDKLTRLVKRIKRKYNYRNFDITLKKV